MASIEFQVRHRFDQEPKVVWDELVDWKSHEHWIPMTRVETGDGAPTDVGHEFTAWTGPKPLALEDRMRVSRCDWDEATNSGACDVDKLGPVLDGAAGFTIGPDGSGAVLEWYEDVTISWLPGFLAPVASKIGSIGFQQGMKRLGKRLSAR